VPSTQLVQLAIQCCLCLVPLETNSVVHRDIAVRNFLLTDNNLKVLLSDFGLAKQLKTIDQGSGGVYQSTTDVSLPVKWCPPEVLLSKKFSTASDRYSLGVTLWEVFNCGAVPFAKYSATELVQIVFKSANEFPRLQKTDAISDAQYGLVLKLTDSDPTKRPLITEVVNQLKEMPMDARSRVSTGAAARLMQSQDMKTVVLLNNVNLYVMSPS